MASSMVMFNFNSTILAVIPIVSHTLMVQIFVGLIFARSKTYEIYGIFFRGCCISWNFVVNSTEIMTFYSIFHAVFAKIVKIKIFMRLIFVNKQNWICLGIYVLEFGQNLRNSRKLVPRKFLPLSTKFDQNTFT